MSYARFSYADVYVFLNVEGYLSCCGCSFPDPEQTDFDTTADLLAHLAKHRAAGHDVPEETLDALKADAVENDTWIAKVAAGMCPSCEGARWVQNPPPGWEACWRCNHDGKIGTKPEPREWSAAVLKENGARTIPDPPPMRPGGCGVTTAGPIPPGTPPGRLAPPPRKP